MWFSDLVYNLFIAVQQTVCKNTELLHVFYIKYTSQIFNDKQTLSELSNAKYLSRNFIFQRYPFIIKNICYFQIIWWVKALFSTSGCPYFMYYTAKVFRFPLPFSCWETFSYFYIKKQKAKIYSFVQNMQYCSWGLLRNSQYLKNLLTVIRT